MKKKMRNKAGAELYKKVESRINANKGKRCVDVQSFEIQGSSVIKQSASIINPFVAEGLITNGHDVSMHHVFRSNVRMIDYALNVGRVEKIRLETIDEQVNVLTNNTLSKSTAVREKLKKMGRSIYDLHNAVRQGKLIEHLSLNYIAGVNMADIAREATAVGLVRRIAPKNTELRRMLEKAGVDIYDDEAIVQFTTLIEFRDFMNRYYRSDVFFKPRTQLIEELRNDGETDELTSDNYVDYTAEITRGINLSDTETDRFKKEMILWLMNKSDVEPWLIKAVEQSMSSKVS